MPLKNLKMQRIFSLSLKYFQILYFVGYTLRGGIPLQLTVSFKKNFVVSFSFSFIFISVFMCVHFSFDVFSSFLLPLFLLSLLHIDISITFYQRNLFSTSFLDCFSFWFLKVSLILNKLCHRYVKIIFIYLPLVQQLELHIATHLQRKKK